VQLKIIFLNLEENEYAQNNMNVLTVMTQQNSQNLSVNDRKS